MKNIITTASLLSFINVCLGDRWSDQRIVDELISFCSKQRDPDYDVELHDNCIVLIDGLNDANN